MKCRNVSSEPAKFSIGSQLEKKVKHQIDGVSQEHSRIIRRLVAFPLE